MIVHCHTNLNESWPESLPAVPRVGEQIQSATRHDDFQLMLQVVAVRWQKHKRGDDWYAHIELHMTEFQKKLPCRSGSKFDGSLLAFYEWYAPLVGRTVGFFM